jgi:predicted nucleic acid-binding protein
VIYALNEKESMMSTINRSAVRGSCFDASALVKNYTEESGSDIIREYWRSEATRYTTPFCYFETLSALKVKWKYKHDITEDKYHKASAELTFWFANIARNVHDLDFTSPSVFFAAQAMAKKYSLDLSDAFQILSVKEGFFSRMSGDSSTILVTADEGLAKAARSEGIKVWYCMKEPVP